MPSFPSQHSGSKHAPAGPVRIEQRLERIFFSMRWIVAPLYFGLTVGLLTVAIKFAQLLFRLALSSFSLSFDDVFVSVLDLIDLALLANLLLIVMFSGYENFVSRLDIEKDDDYPTWMGHVTFGDIKLKLMASIIAMSAIHVLADFIRVDQTSTRALAWDVGIHLAFVISGVLMAVMDKLMDDYSGAGSPAQIGHPCPADAPDVAAPPPAPCPPSPRASSPRLRAPAAAPAAAKDGPAGVPEKKR